MLKDPEKCKDLTHGSIQKVDLICDYCGNDFTQPWRVRVKVQKKLNPKDSCPKCRMKKREETSLLVYGVKNPSQSKVAREKSSKTRGGTGKVVSDYKEQILELYDQENMSVKQISEKLELGKTVLRKYMINLGLDVTGDPQLKAQKTTKERYGQPHFLQSEIGQQKLKQSLREKYGSENPYENKGYKKNHIEKMTKTCLDKYGVRYILQDPNRQEEFEQKRKQKRVQNGQLLYDNKTIEQIAIEKGMCPSTLYEKIRNVGLEEAIRSEKYQTNIELIMKNLLEENNIKFKTEFFVGGRFADFYLEDYNIIIEVDGLYWHSDKIIKDYLYHVKKRQIYIDNNFYPLFFRENEILLKKNIVESIIINKLKLNKYRVGARKCKIEKIDKTLGDSFFEENHLMGKGQGKYYGLIYNNELISCICIKSILDGFEISRFCNKLNYSIIGGFSKLIKFSMSDLNINKLITFIDLRYGDGKYLENLGFNYIHTYPSFKWTNAREILHRLTFPGNSGYEKGFVKIWDCGQAKYILQTANINNSIISY